MSGKSTRRKRAFSLAIALLAAPALAQQPASIGIDHTQAPEPLSVLDHTGAWVQFGAVDPAAHSFSLTAAAADITGAITAPGGGQFWAQDGADIHRLNDRLFVGGATANDGAYPNVAQDWLSTLQVGWGHPIGYTTGSIFNSLTTTDPSSEYGIIGGAETSQQTAVGALAIGVSAFGVSNNTTNHTTSWGFYGEAHLVNGSSSAAVAEELEAVAHIAALAPTPNGQGNVVGLQDGCGGGYTGFTQQNCSSAIQIVGNGGKFQAGIDVLAGSLAASAPALMLPVGNGIAFYDASGHAVQITSTFTANDSGSIIFADGGIEMTSALFPTADNAYILGLPTLRWSNVYAANATVNRYQTVAAVPTVSSCGTSPPVVTAGSNDNAGEFTLGTGTVSVCTVTFATPYPANSFCTVTPEQSMGATVWWLSARLNFGFSISLSASMPGAKFTYVCLGN